METKNPFDLVSFKDAADILQTNQNTLRHKVQNREITYIKIFGRIMFRFSDLEAYVNAQIRPALPPPVRQKSGLDSSAELQRKEAQREARERKERLLQKWQEEAASQPDTPRDELLRRSVGPLAYPERGKKRAS